MMHKLRLLVAAFAMVFTMGFAAVGTSSAFDLFGDPCSNAASKDATVCQDAKEKQTPGNNSIYGPNGIVTTIVKILSMVIGVAAVIMIIVAGMQYMLSNGDSTKIANAKNTIIYAAIGIVVAVLSRTLVIYIIQRMPS